MKWILFFFFLTFSTFVLQARRRPCARCTALQARESAGVSRFYITLHKAEQRKLISPNLYSQKLKIHIIKASKWLSSIKGQRWSPEHHNTTHSFGEKQERREQFSTGRNDTRFIVLLQSHVIQFRRVDIRFHSFMFIQQKKKSNLYAILFKNDAKDDCEFPSGIMQKTRVSARGRKIKLEN